ncbi:aldehyde dehydrogenase family protein [Micromonospora echinospora]|uniref:aldehyde dehydrogenase family protein n=1 Tax=Micromonospora echinospora TaxID=1877 RepID=UPI0037985EE2
MSDTSTGKATVTTSTLTLRNLVNGTYVEGAAGTDVSTNPADSSDVVAVVPRMSADEARSAVDAAAAALPAWRNTPSVLRGKHLFAVAALIRERADQFRDTICREMGKTTAEATIEVERSAELVEFFAGVGRLPHGDVVPDRRPGVVTTTRHEPIGVVLAITPWNDPLMVPVRKAAPALIRGNTVVLKPSPDTPAVALLLAQVMQDAGLPAGTFNTVTGDVAEIGDALVRDPRIAGITFTGSTATGRHLGQAIAGTATRLQTEMGGKNAAVIMADADVTRALEVLLPSIFGQTGQRCTAVSRLLVHRDRYDEVVEQIVARAGTVAVGPAADATTTMGPVVNQRQLDKVLTMIDTAREQGAVIAAGGERLIDGAAARGCFVRPTVITGVSADMRIWTDEVFGPVVAVMPFDDLDEAIGIANDTTYGLASGIFTNNLAAAEAFVRGMETGQVVVNLAPSGWDVHQAFGGFKESGSAFKEHGLDGLAFYTRVKTVAVSATP